MRRTAIRSSTLMAEEGIRALARAPAARCRRIARDLEARSDALYGAWLCGTVLGNVAMGLHHKLCHTLGGSFNLPHAEMHTVVLPHALAYNAAAAAAGDGAHARARRQRRAARCERAARRLRPRARPRRADRAARHRHAGRRPRPRRRPRGAEPVPEPAAARTRRASATLLQRAYDGARPD